MALQVLRNYDDENEYIVKNLINTVGSECFRIYMLCLHLYQDMIAIVTHTNIIPINTKSMPLYKSSIVSTYLLVLLSASQ